MAMAGIVMRLPDDRKVFKEGMNLHFDEIDENFELLVVNSFCDGRSI